MTDMMITQNQFYVKQEKVDNIIKPTMQMEIQASHLAKYERVSTIITVSDIFNF